MLSKNEFAEQLKKDLSEVINFGSNTIDIQEMTKDNVVLTGIVIKDDSNIAPVIYVEKYYEQYLDGEDYSEIVDKIIDTYENAKRSQPTIQAEDFLNYDKVKDKLLLSIVNYEANAEMLENLPHERIKDLAVYARIEAISDRNSIGTVKVSNILLENYGISSKELLADARESMHKRNPMVFKDMIDVIKGMHPDIPDFIANEMESNRGELYVISASNQISGAVYGFDKDVLADISERIDSEKLYVLPSSINEVIIVPGDKGNDPMSLKDMVGQVNAEVVPEAEVLSDNAYVFDSKTKELSVIGGDEPEKNKTVGRDR